MWPFLQNLATRGGSRALGLLDDFGRQQVVLGMRRAGLPVRKQAAQGGLTGVVGELRQAAASPLARRSTQAAASLVGLTVADESGLTGKIENTLNQFGPGIDRFFGSITPQAIQQFGKNQEKKGFGGVLELATPFGFLAAPFIPNTPGTTTQKPPIKKLPPGSTESELAAGAGFPGQQQQVSSDPRQRAQDQERSRVAQMTEQDPLFKKYRVAELTKAYNTASPEDKEKIGLEIWATTNPTLARELKPGQLGYTQATSAIMSQSPLGQFQAQTGDMQYANKMDQVPGAMAGFQPQTPLTGIPTPAAPQFGASEVFAKATPIPGATEMFTDPRKFLNQEELSQTQLALLKKAFESRLK